MPATVADRCLLREESLFRGHDQGVGGDIDLNDIQRHGPCHANAFALADGVSGQALVFPQDGAVFRVTVQA